MLLRRREFRSSRTYEILNCSHLRTHIPALPMLEDERSAKMSGESISHCLFFSLLSNTLLY